MGFGPAISAAGSRGRAGAGGGGETADGGVDNARFLLLAVVLVIYMLAGAALFQYLEEDSELKVDRDFWKLYEDFQKRMENGTLDMGRVRELLHAYGNATTAGSIDRRRRWDFAGSFHFVGTIVSTIGKWIGFGIFSGSWEHQPQAIVDEDCSSQMVVIPNLKLLYHRGRFLFPCFGVVMSVRHFCGG
ncbi:hypothetical protein J437_LFUL006301 [Ladona fulva]|uniref:Potassium channel subfamily K member 13 n=1 Tax=Ladona fulva TaxID=123851 RepID=A0A8K0NYU4_LADFU|nr:hypothetical protein J437_LFUL006301 [Ladona fulva]